MDTDKLVKRPFFYFPTLTLCEEGNLVTKCDHINNRKTVLFYTKIYVNHRDPGPVMYVQYTKSIKLLI